jgi:hypothetical protein
MRLNRLRANCPRFGEKVRIVSLISSFRAARALFPLWKHQTHEQADAAPANGTPDDVGRCFSSLWLRGILVLDLGNGISGFAKSNQHSLGEMSTFFVTFRDLVPRRAVPRTGMINESGFDGACYDDKGVF